MLKLFLGSNVFRDNPQLGHLNPGAQYDIYVLSQVLKSNGHRVQYVMGNKLMVDNHYYISSDGMVTSI